MNLRSAFFALILTLAANALAASPYVIVLGIGQDAGVPQIGCNSPFCCEGWKDPRLKRMGSPIALVDQKIGL